MTCRLVPVLLLAGALGAVVLPLRAATVCSISASQLAFGVYDAVSGAANDTTGNVTVACIPGLSDPLTTAYTVTVDGTGVTSDSVRSMSRGAYRLYFQVYKDPARTTVWGSSPSAGVAGSVTSATTLVAAQRTHTAYARLPPGQNVPPGLYSGSLLVTIEY